MNTTSQTATGRGTKTRTANRPVASETKKSAAPDLSRFPDRWISAPTRGHQPDCGLSRPHLYDLARAGKIKSACLRRPGAVRGARRFHLGSILAYLESEAAATYAREAAK